MSKECESVCECVGWGGVVRNVRHVVSGFELLFRDLLGGGFEVASLVVFFLLFGRCFLWCCAVFSRVVAIPSLNRKGARSANY